MIIFIRYKPQLFPNVLFYLLIENKPWEGEFKNERKAAQYIFSHTCFTCFPMLKWRLNIGIPRSRDNWFGLFFQYDKI